MTRMPWSLFIDDIRNPPPGDWVVCRSTRAALDTVKQMGMPSFISFDHDLGGDDTTMVFLHRLTNEIWDGTSPPPDYYIHSANPVGSINIHSFMDSWRRSIL